MREKNGTFKEGNKGRPKGAKNKTTNIGKDKISKYLEKEGYKALIDTIKKLDDKDKVTALLKLIEFVVPKQKAIEHSGSDTPFGSINVSFTTDSIPPITSENDTFNDD